MAERGEGVIEAEAELSGLRTMVPDLVERVAHLNQDVSGLMAARGGWGLRRDICHRPGSRSAGNAH